MNHIITKHFAKIDEAYFHELQIEPHCLFILDFYFDYLPLMESFRMELLQVLYADFKNLNHQHLMSFYHFKIHLLLLMFLKVHLKTFHLNDLFQFEQYHLVDLHWNQVNPLSHRHQAHLHLGLSKPANP